jgi:hypothetical protein
MFIIFVIGFVVGGLASVVIMSLLFMGRDTTV